MSQTPLGSVVVVGGGIVGIMSALNMANAGFYVHIIEKKSGLGGVMAQLDKIFPTNDCSLCLLSPELVQCSRHLNIELHMQSEIIDVQGQEGDLTVKVLNRPDYIDMDKCIACNRCSEVCPVSVSNDFNAGLNNRKAIYILYGQSVPQKYVIDDKSCLRLQRCMGGACSKVCPTQAINFDAQEKIEELRVGSMILSSGFVQFNPNIFDTYNYCNLPDVITSIEYERLISASGPWKGHLRRPSDYREPHRIAWLQCVGSREINKCDNGICSSICCMYSIKQAQVTNEHIDAEDFQATIFYMDIRAHGKGYEQFYESAKEKGVRFIRSRPHTVMPGKDKKGVVLEYFGEDDAMHTEEFDLLVLSVGMVPGEDAVLLSRILGLELDRYNFIKTSSFAPHTTSRSGIYAAGSILSPRDIPQSVTDALGAASSATIPLAKARGSLTLERLFPPEKDIRDQNPRIGVFICSCGTNISDVVDVQELKRFTARLPQVVHVENNVFTCPQITQEKIIREIEEFGLNRVVVAACTPKTHEPVYQQTLREAGLNPHLFELANIRNQNSWVHRDSPALATEKAKLQIQSAVAKARLLEPLHGISKNVVPKALIVGGGLSGMAASLTLADQGFETFLVEKSGALGGAAWDLRTTWKGEDILAHMQDTINRINNHPLITQYKHSQVVSCQGSLGNFFSDVQRKQSDGKTETIQINYGAALLCTGGKELIPDEYMYGEDVRIFTHHEFDKLVKADFDYFRDFKKINSVVFIQCVGSREPEHPYCSRVCCTHTIETALLLKNMNPEINIYVLNRDIRTYGTRETLYQEARSRGVLFIRYTKDNKPTVFKRGDDLLVMVEDHILKRPLELQADFLVLAAAIVPHEANASLAKLFNCTMNNDGFMAESNTYIKPVDLSNQGVFAAGLCDYPKPVDEAITQAKAAAARISTILSKPAITLDVYKAVIKEECDGCGACVEECPFDALTLKKTFQKGHVQTSLQVDPVLCEGCGICAASCPKDGIEVKGYTLDQIRAQSDAVILRKTEKIKCDPFEPRIVAFCCNWCSYAAADTAGVFRLKYPPHVIPIRVMCSGMVHPDMVIEALAKGADGVMVLGCHLGECTYRQGNYKALKWSEGIRSTLAELGISPQRYHIDWVSSAEGPKFAEIITAFTRTIQELGPNSTEQ